MRYGGSAAGTRGDGYDLLYDELLAGEMGDMSEFGRDGNSCDSL